MPIQTIAVLGSGVMGAGIAALAANAGCKVILLDIVLPNAENRNELTEKAVQKQLAAGGFTHPDNATRVTCGNLEDHLGLLKDADWIIEAVLEKLDVKQGVYRKVDAARKKGSVVSSNTSTIPLHDLTAGLGETFAQDFMIAHFFNPPRHMRLLEVVKGEKTRQDAFDAVCQFADESLGKQVVLCKDTPGFIGNRIGVFWLFTGFFEAEKLGITVEEADALMGRALGFPKTGVFGLFDLIGLDLMPLIAKSMLDSLPPDDAFRRMFHDSDLLAKLIAGGYTGRKGKGGFYRMEKQGDKKVKQSVDLKSGEYRAEAPASLASAKAKTPAELFSATDKGGEYVRAVMGKTLAYTASLVPQIADDITSVDAAMKSGYSWANGPFELVDRIGVKALTDYLKREGIPVPAMLAKAQPFYDGVKHLTVEGAYAPVQEKPGHLWLSDVKRNTEALMSNASASVWDLGDGIACLEFTSKMNAVDHNILAMIEQLIPRVQQDFKGLVIGNDADNFCVGANLNVFLEHAKNEEWSQISDIIRRGQQAFMGLKTAPFPVVSALTGLALGGGCEILLHSSAVQAHMESYPGLVEAGVGIIPAWGGCKEMLLRHGDAIKTFELIITTAKAGSAQDARDMKVLNAQSAITMNRARLLADAKAKCVQLAKGYAAAKPATIHTAGAIAKNGMLARLEAYDAEGKTSPHDLVIGRVLAHVLSGGETNGSVTEQKMLDLEHDGFMELVRTTASQVRIEHMLKTGKPLKN